MNVNFNELVTIKEFDMGINMSADECVRLLEIPDDIQNSEINLIYWLLLELEFERTKSEITTLPAKETRRRKYQTDGIEKENSVIDETDAQFNSLDGENGSTRPFHLLNRVSRCGGLAKRFKTSADISKLNSAKKFAEDLLKSIGIEIPWDDLSTKERQSLFMQFCASSELLREERLGSILDLYQALRRRSKFREQFEILGTLGSGNYGNVYSVRPRLNLNSSNSASRCQPTCTYAIKKISMTLNNSEEIRMLLNESAALKKLDGHPNIVRFFDSWIEVDYDDDEDDEEEPLKFYLQMEMCGISLYQWKEKTKNVSVSVLVDIATQLSYGLDYIHSSGIIHLDINPKNIIWEDDQKKTVKIGDFGLAIQGSSFEGASGTRPYCAPESLLTAKSDMYSLGVTLFEVSQGISTISELFTRIDRRQIKTGIRFMDEILPSLLDPNPMLRPSASALYVKLQAFH